MSEYVNQHLLTQNEMLRAQVEEFNDAPVGGEERWVMPALHQAARRMCDGPMVDLLMSCGANPNRLYKGYSAYGFARVYGNAPLAHAIEAAGKPPRLNPEEELLAQAAEGRLQQGAHVFSYEYVRLAATDSMCAMIQFHVRFAVTVITVPGSNFMCALCSSRCI